MPHFHREVVVSRPTDKLWDMLLRPVSPTCRSADWTTVLLKKKTVDVSMTIGPNYYAASFRFTFGRYYFSAPREPRF
jgi:hypothetical protein